MSQKRLFVRRLAEFLVEDQAKKGIQLGMGYKHAQDWAALRSATPLFGYPTVDEAEATLAEWLNIPAD